MPTFLYAVVGAFEVVDFELDVLLELDVFEEADVLGAVCTFSVVVISDSEGIISLCSDSVVGSAEEGALASTIDVSGIPAACVFVYGSESE